MPLIRLIDYADAIFADDIQPAAAYQPRASLCIYYVLPARLR